jgi:hypothetical protein
MAATHRVWSQSLYGLAFLLIFGFPAAIMAQDGQPVRAEPLPVSARLNSGYCLSAARAALERGNLDEAEAWALQAEKAPMRFLDWVKDCFSNGTVKIWREIQTARTREMTAQIDEIVRYEISKPKETSEPDRLTDATKRREASLRAKDIAALQNQFFAITSKPIVYEAGKDIGRASFGTATVKPHPESPFKRDDMSRLAAYLQRNYASYSQKTARPGPQASSEELLIKACYQFLHGNFQYAKTLGLWARAVDTAKIILPPDVTPDNITLAENKHSAAITVNTGEMPSNTQPSGPSDEEESEAHVQLVKSQLARNRFNGWFLGIGLGMGVFLVSLFRKNVWHFFRVRAGQSER